MNHTLLVATTNVGKLREFQSLLAELPVTLVSLHDVGCAKKHVVEDGLTFAANAIKKAKAFAVETSLPTLADDSGLEVDALGGAPGVRSARYAGERATDAENNTALIRALDTLESSGLEPGIVTPQGPFLARFRCTLAFVDPFDPQGEPTLAHGTCEGEVIRTSRGTSGFGYDPLFVVRGLGKTLAELSADEKNRVSHRAQAVLRMRPLLSTWATQRRAGIDTVLRG